MDFEEYQRRAWSTAIYPNKGNNLMYPVCGLAGEAGEVAGKFSKICRDDNNILTPNRREQLIDELCDVLWFTNACCIELNITLEELAERNIQKLTLRKEKGTLKGDGDKR